MSKSTLKLLALCLSLCLLFVAIPALALIGPDNQTDIDPAEVQAALESPLPLTLDSLQSTSFVSGEEARYTISFIAPDDLALQDSSLQVDFPAGFQIVQNDITHEDPGCTLASVQYKNKSSDKFWSVLQGNAAVSPESDHTRFELEVATTASADVNSGVKVYLVIPGVVNGPDGGNLTLTLQTGGVSYSGSTTLTLGSAPALAPAGLSVAAPGSYKISAEWSPVEGATRYQLWFSLDPQGCFIQAYDFGKEPNPGQEGNITGTNCTFTANGNGGLAAGRVYYFKVKAGNEFGFGPFSEMVEVTTPVINFLKPDGKANGHHRSSPLEVMVDQPVEIVDPDRIMLYKAATGKPLDAEISCASSTITIEADLESGKRYQAVFYPDALKAEQEEVYNALFGYEFTAKVDKPKKGGE